MFLRFSEDTDILLGWFSVFMMGFWSCGDALALFVWDLPCLAHLLCCPRSLDPALEVSHNLKSLKCINESGIG